MKARRYLMIAATVRAVSASGAFAAIVGSEHDFSGSGWSLGEICRPCHTPHLSNTAIGYLWNHAVPDDADFIKWPGATLGPESLMCLGCHDGQTAIDSFGGSTGGTVISGSSNIGLDLTDDHPVGVEYGTSTRMAPVGTIWGGQPAIVVGYGGLPLFGADNTIECITCHTPHSNDNGSFLRVDNSDSSALCVACHISI